jgi:hypothetical protein
VGALQRHDLDQQPISLAGQLLNAAAGTLSLDAGKRSSLLPLWSAPDGQDLATSLPLVRRTDPGNG